MKKLLLISAFLVSASMMFGQFTINYSGSITNYPATAVKMYLEVDSIVVDSTLTNTSTGSYMDSTNVLTRPFMIRILFYDCHGNQVADFYSPPPAATSYRVAFRTLNYCSPSPCSAGFTKHQAIDPVSRLPIPNKAILVDRSTGTGLTYSWNFGDGSAPVSGLNVTHTYSTHGSYNICLTVVGTTTAGTCTSTFCDTLTVDSSGNVRSSFTVTTGNSSTSIKENELLTNVKLYPNPAQSYAVLDFNSASLADIVIKVIDVKGREILNIDKTVNTGMNKINLPVDNLGEGMYLIQILNGNTVLTQRLQIVR